jgi:hypothetical protein
MSNTNTKIFSEAIAEAKSIRETAMANAKLALEEAFAPRMQEMMSSRLEALAEDNDEMEEEFKKSNGEMPGDNSMEEISLEELLAELEALEETSGHEENPEDKDTYMSNDGYGKVSSKKGVNDPYMEENEIFEEAEDDDTVAEITVDDLKDIIRSVVADLMGGPEEEESGEGEGEPGHEEGETPEEEAGEGEDELSLEEILAELDLDETAAYEEGKTQMQEKAKDDKSNEELEEAMNTIATLRSELNEVNLLNAKLLYVNKLFKSKNLTEAQKVKVINAFDRAETVKETKNIFETLQESLNVTPAKNSIKESLSYASKATGVTDRKPIVENNDFVARMQKLAGII